MNQNKICTDVRFLADYVKARDLKRTNIEMASDEYLKSLLINDDDTFKIGGSDFIEYTENLLGFSHYATDKKFLLTFLIESVNVINSAISAKELYESCFKKDNHGNMVPNTLISIVLDGIKCLHKPKLDSAYVTIPLNNDDDLLFLSDSIHYESILKFYNEIKRENEDFIDDVCSTPDKQIIAIYTIVFLLLDYFNDNFFTTWKLNKAIQYDDKGNPKFTYDSNHFSGTYNNLRKFSKNYASILSDYKIYKPDNASTYLHLMPYVILLGELLNKPIKENVTLLMKKGCKPFNLAYFFMFYTKGKGVMLSLETYPIVPDIMGAHLKDLPLSDDIVSINNNLQLFDRLKTKKQGMTFKDEQTLPSIICKYLVYSFIYLRSNRTRMRLGNIIFLLTSKVSFKCFDLYIYSKYSTLIATAQKFGEILENINTYPETKIPQGTKELLSRLFHTEYIVNYEDIAEYYDTINRHREKIILNADDIKSEYSQADRNISTSFTYKAISEFYYDCSKDQYFLNNIAKYKKFTIKRNQYDYDSAFLNNIILRVNSAENTLEVVKYPQLKNIISLYEKEELNGKESNEKFISAKITGWLKMVESS